MNWPLLETQCFEFLGHGRNAIHAIEIELHCRGPALHDHLLENPGSSVLALTRIEHRALGVGRRRLSGRIGEFRFGWGEENDERKNQGSEGFL